MAFLPKDLSVLAYANGFTLWHYATPDTAAEVAGGGYFDSAADILRPGDMILANVETDAELQGGLLVVRSSADGAVTVGGMTAIAG